MRWWWVLGLIAGCAWITDEEQDARYDPDGDGVSWPDDCDDEDPLVSSPSAWFVDQDADGYGAGEPVEACVAPEGHVVEGGDCDDADPDVHPGTVWYADTDRDGFGDAAASVTACEAPADHVADATDCDDAHATAFPGGVEACDADDVDEDCDGFADDADSDATGGATFYADRDDDGFGDASSAQSACEAPAGYVGDATDCDDAVTDIHPGAAEICDALGEDEDCNGVANEADSGATGLATWYADTDGDGFGDVAITETTCTPPGGYVGDATDCDDDAATTHPGAAEYCDGIDSDCDGTLDEADAVDAPSWHADGDGDGYGAPTATVRQCAAGAGALADGTDCDDADASVNPGAAETFYDGVDADCAGDDDYDADGDGYASDAWGGVDCDDTDAAVFPGRTIAVPGDASTVQAGIDLACDGDVVTVAAGTWVGAVDFGAKDVTVTGAGDSTILSDTVTMSAGTLQSVRVNGAESTGIGGCIAITGAATVRNVLVDGCAAAYGGGIGVDTSGAVVLEGVTLRSNTASADGGGLYATGTADLTLTDVTIAGNDAGSGGGIALDGVGGTATGLWIEDNTATTCAGVDAINLALATPWTLAESTIVGNTASSSNGGVCLTGEGATLEQIAVLDASGGGAALLVTGGVDATGLVVAGGDGDGLGLDPVTSGVSLSVVNATIVGNGGDGVQTEPRKPKQITLTNLIVAWNGAYGVHDVSASRDPDLTYSDGYANDSGPVTGMTPGTGNIIGDPEFVSYSRARSAVYADFHLRSTSPAADAGDSAITDSDGSASDMGAFGGPSADASWYDDADGDGLPDGWESAWGVSDAASDPDGDGLTNAAEYAAGTFPTASDTDADGSGDASDTDPLDPTDA